MGSLRDRGKRLKAGDSKPTTPKPAPTPPLVEEKVAPPPGHKPLVVRPPARKRSVTVKPVPAPPPMEEAVPAAPPAEELPTSAPTSRNEATVPARRIPKVVVAPQGPGTEQLSVSDMELIEDEAATSRDPVAPVSAPESATAAARPAPNMENPPEKIARFNSPGNVVNLRIAGIKLKLADIMGPETVKLLVLGGKEEYTPVLNKGVQATLPSLETSSGEYVNVLLTYNGLSTDGSALEVHCVVEGTAKTLAQTLGRAASKAREIAAGAPSSWRYLSNIVAAGAGIAAIVASFTMTGMKALGSFGQYGIAAAGVVAAGLGLWSIIERMRHNDNIR